MLRFFSMKFLLEILNGKKRLMPFFLLLLFSLPFAGETPTEYSKTNAETQLGFQLFNSEHNPCFFSRFTPDQNLFTPPSKHAKFAKIFIHSNFFTLAGIETATLSYSKHNPLVLTTRRIFTSLPRAPPRNFPC
jgi:hypothetical protein